MPTRADVEAATPKCPRYPGADLGDLAGDPCYRLLEWDDAHARWSCPEHGPVHTGSGLAAAQRPVEHVGPHRSEL